jgi:hypothetical protein
MPVLFKRSPSGLLISCPVLEGPPRKRPISSVIKPGSALLAKWI